MTTTLRLIDGVVIGYSRDHVINICLAFTVFEERICHWDVVRMCSPATVREVGSRVGFVPLLTWFVELLN